MSNAFRAPPPAHQESPPLSSPERLVHLLSRVADKDREAFAELYEASVAKLFGTVLRILKQQAWANDVIQEVYVTIWHKAGRFESERASAITWMVTIARNAAIDELRKAPTRPTESDSILENWVAETPSAYDQRHQDETSTQLTLCLDELEESRQQMVRLAYLEGWSRADLASHFDQPVNTVKTWLHRALKQLKGCLGS